MSAEKNGASGLSAVEQDSEIGELRDRVILALRARAFAMNGNGHAAPRLREVFLVRMTAFEPEDQPEPSRA